MVKGGYPPDTGKFLKDKVEELREAKQAAQEVYGKEIQRSESGMPTATCAESTAVADAAVASIEKAVKDFLSGPGGNMLKLAT